MGSPILAAMVLGPVQFDRPEWLLLVPVLGVACWWLSRRSLSGLGKGSRWAALTARILAVALLAGALAQPQLRRVSEAVGVTFVVDVSRSIPTGAQERIDRWVLESQDGSRLEDDMMGVVTAAEAAFVQSSPSRLVRQIERQFLGGRDASNLGGALNLASAVAPKDAAGRIVLITDGNETAGSLLRAAEQARAAGIPVDVLPVEFDIREEVVVEDVQVPSGVRVGETVSLRVVLTTTAPVVGRLMVSENGQVIDLDAEDPTQSGALVRLDAGRHVLSVPVTPRRPGPQLYDAVFEPLASLNAQGEPGTTRGDAIIENNRANAITFVASEGRVLLVGDTPEEWGPIEEVLAASEIATQRVSASGLPSTLPELAAYEAIILINQSAYDSTVQQQELLRQYVHDTGGGLVMIGGPESFGAGGWIGSPLADALPIRLDPPQKRQMPRGALALIVHSVEIPQGVFYGKQVANAAVDALSRLDLIGIIEYQGFGGTDWVYPMAPVGDKSSVKRAINALTFGDMPSFDPSMNLALAGLQAAEAGQKHCIIISDGDPTLSRSILRQFRQSGITISTVGVNPHSPGDLNTLRTMALETGGTFYSVGNNALETLPQIFIKEAQTLRRALIWEGEPFSPARTGAPTETMRGISAVPPIRGYVVAAEREGLSLVTLRGKEEDPIAAQWQHGLGRVITFTSDASSRWAGAWVGWDGFKQFWEQHVRWAMRPGDNASMRVVTENRGDQTVIIVEAFDPDGERLNFARFNARIATPDGGGADLELRQVGPGRYEGAFDSSDAGAYVISARYRAAVGSGSGDEAQILEGAVQAAVTRPYADEFRALRTNTPLLQQVAAMTGGRVLTGDPLAAGLWSRDGLTMPVALRPVWLAFLIAGVVVFLADVGIRRVRIEPRAIAAWLRRSASKEGERSTQATEAFRSVKGRRASPMPTGGSPDEQRQRAARRFEATPDRPVSSEPVALSGQEEAASPLRKQDRPRVQDEGPKDSLSALRAAKKRAQEDLEDRSKQRPDAN
jgi:uncharacterized membrane protein